MGIEKVDFLNKHGDVIVTFSSYYKYKFTYMAEIDGGMRITASVGGDSDDIYRMEVENNEQIKLRDLDPESAYVYKNGVEQYGYYDY